MIRIHKSNAEPLTFPLPFVTKNQNTKCST